MECIIFEKKISYIMYYLLFIIKLKKYLTNKHDEDVDVI